MIRKYIMCSFLISIASIPVLVIGEDRDGQDFQESKLTKRSDKSLAIQHNENYIEDEILNYHAVLKSVKKFDSAFSECLEFSNHQLCMTLQKGRSTQNWNVDNIGSITTGGRYISVEIPEPLYSNFSQYDIALDLLNSRSEFKVDTGYKGGLAINKHNEVVDMADGADRFIGMVKSYFRFNKSDIAPWYIADRVSTTLGEDVGSTFIAVHSTISHNLLGLSFLKKFETVCLGGIESNVVFNCRIDKSLDNLPFYYRDNQLRLSAKINGFDQECLLSSGSQYSSAPLEVFDLELLIEREFYNAPFELITSRLGMAEIKVGEYRESLPVLVDEECVLGMDFFGTARDFQLDFVNERVYWSSVSASPN